MGRNIDHKCMSVTVAGKQNLFRLDLPASMKLTGNFPGSMKRNEN